MFYQINQDKAKILEAQTSLSDLQLQLDILKTEKDILDKQVLDYMSLNERQQRRLLSHSNTLKTYALKVHSQAIENVKETLEYAKDLASSYYSALEMVWALQIELENEVLERRNLELVHKGILEQQKVSLENLKKHQKVLSEIISPDKSELEYLSPTGHWESALEAVDAIILDFAEAQKDGPQIESMIQEMNLHPMVNKQADTQDFGGKMSQLLEGSVLLKNGLSKLLDLKQATLEADDAFELLENKFDNLHQGSHVVSSQPSESILMRIRSGLAGVSTLLPVLNRLLSEGHMPMSEPNLPLDTPLRLSIDGTRASPARGLMRYIEKQQKKIERLSAQVKSEQDCIIYTNNILIIGY